MPGYIQFYTGLECLSSEIVLNNHNALKASFLVLQHWDDVDEVRHPLSREIYKKADLHIWVRTIV